MSLLNTKELKRQIKEGTFTGLDEGLFKNLCQAGKIEDTKGHRNENRNRCGTICKRY